MILAELISEVQKKALAEGIPESDFWYVISHYLNLSRNEIFLSRKRILTELERKTIAEAISRLEKGEPPQYITNVAYFYGLELKVNPATLIPRPETEHLVEITLNHLKGKEKILDIGTGSGAIAIALKYNLPSLNVFATEISSSALNIAKENAQKYSADIHFSLADCFPVDGETYDVIISNPPYIRSNELSSLETKIRDYEPTIALDGGEDGLAFYRKLLSLSSAYLATGGFLALEYGETQKETIMATAEKEGWTKIDPYKDWNERDRYLFLYR
ncbi:MAG: peptide chain release factor N(5)-glutamine methyltransferase [Candidatus Cloacimonas sp.]